MDQHPFPHLTATLDNLPSGSNDESDFGLGLNEEVSGSLGVSLGLDDALLFGGVLLLVLFGVGEVYFSLFSSISLGGSSGLGAGLSDLGIACSLLLEALGDDPESVSWEFGYFLPIEGILNILIY